MKKTTPEKRVQDAYDAIAEADREAERLRREARINFGRVVTEVVEAKELQQEAVAGQVGKTREWVRRQQVDARNAAKKKQTP